LNTYYFAVQSSDKSQHDTLNSVQAFHAAVFTPEHCHKLEITLVQAFKGAEMFRMNLFLLLTTGCALSVYSQTTTAPSAPVTEKPRVFVTDSQSWETRGNAGGANGAFAAHSAGGARPQTAEIIKTFGEKCPTVMVNNIQAKANYIVVLDHEGGKGYLQHKNKVAVFDAQSGDSVVSKSTLSLGGSVDEACRGIAKHWTEHPQPSSADSGKLNSPTASAPTIPTEGEKHANLTAAEADAIVALISNPVGADVSVDDAFVGSAPATLKLKPGKHTIKITMDGYKDWAREINAMAGSQVSLTATMQKPQ
jgi:hypothetical protein